MPDFLRIESPTAVWYRPDWPDWPGLVAGFTTRRWRPTPEEPWRDDWSFRRPPDESAPPGLAHLRAVLDLGDMAVVGEQQVHGVSITTVTHRDIVTPEFSLFRESDGLILQKPGILGLAQAADCCIGLVVQPERRVAALFHAGWRGAVEGLPIRMATQLLIQHGIAPESLWVALCPSIQQTSFQVGPEVARRFGRSDLVVPDPTAENRWLADLPALVAAQLMQVGVPKQRISISTQDTLTDPTDFFSYRRDGAGMGLHVGFCGWRPLR